MTERQARAITSLIWVIAALILVLVLLTAVIVLTILKNYTGHANGGPPIPTERTLTRNDSLLFFFALFWASGFVPLAKYRLFETHRLHGARLKRFGVGLVLADVLPIIILAGCLAWLFPNGALRVPGGVFSAGAAALSLFGIRRVIHGVVVHWKLFDDDEKDDDGTPPLTKLKGDRWGQSARPHFVSGGLWIAGALVIAVVLAFFGL